MKFQTMQNTEAHSYESHFEESFILCCVDVFSLSGEFPEASRQVSKQASIVRNFVLALRLAGRREAKVEERNGQVSSFFGGESTLW